MANLLRLDDSFKLTKPFHEAWLDAHRDSMDLLNRARKDMPEFFVPFEPVDYWDMLHRHVFANASRAVEGKQGIVSTNKVGFNAQIVAGKSPALVRFKHLLTNLAPRAYPTVQQTGLDKHQFSEDMLLQLQMDGCSIPPTVLTCGYQVSPTIDELIRVTVVLWHRGVLRHYYDLHNIDGIEMAEYLPFPGTPPESPEVVSKRAKRDKRNPAGDKTE